MRSIIAILRGLTPAEAEAVGEALVAAGTDRMEVPLNEPGGLEAMGLLVRAVGDRAQVGAGTVLSPEAVEAVAAAGGHLVVAPNVDPAVIRRARALGLECIAGAFTATECLAALAAGADGVKLFPAMLLGPAGVAALRTVLPPDVPVYAFGGVRPEDFARYRAAGAGVGLGSALYAPGIGAGEVGRRARAVVAAWEAA